MKLLVAGALLGMLFLASCGGVSQSNTGSGDQSPSAPVSSDDPTPPSTDASSPSVVGQVTDESGKPVAEANMTVSEGSVAVPEIVVITNSAGEYQWDLPVGSFTLAVFADGYERQAAEVVVAEGEVVRQDFVLQRAP